jgi:hypothetical protein
MLIQKTRRLKMNELTLPDARLIPVKVRVSKTGGVAITVPRDIILKIAEKHNIDVDNIMVKDKDGKYVLNPILQKFFEEVEAIWVFDDFEGFRLVIRKKHR